MGSVWLDGWVFNTAQNLSRGVKLMGWACQILHQIWRRFIHPRRPHTKFAHVCT